MSLLNEYPNLIKLKGSMIFYTLNDLEILKLLHKLNRNIYSKVSELSQNKRLNF